VLCVDDGQLLDDASAALVHQLVAAGEAVAVVSVRISVRTVDNHLQNAYRKLGVTRRQDLPRVLSGTPE
jgi:DNA-binding NarL/FixJ family response regulator